HYFVVNVSSPNTPNLRALQDKEPLTQLLNHLQELNRQKEQPKPILLKIAPDLSNEQLDDIVDIVQSTQIDGLIATNTTIERGGLETPAEKIENFGNGGLSGRPLKQRSTEVIRYLNTAFAGKVPIIGVGGINSPEDAIEKLEAGAALIQVYSGLIFQGPGFIKRINRRILEKMHA
ncbi:MAG: dihydroorotate dehydrogenase (quinone), partial [Phaeodactylibacter sp.]|nr:dihydroorotate dehydrogenase (quinone) [Phaeodactylibacter sp.]